MIEILQNEDGKTWDCTICPIKKLETAGHAYFHVMEHTDNGTPPPGYIAFPFPYRDGNSREYKYLAGQFEPFTRSCPICPLSFKDKYTFSWHLIERHWRIIYRLERDIKGLGRTGEFLDLESLRKPSNGKDVRISCPLRETCDRESYQIQRKTYQRYITTHITNIEHEQQFKRSTLNQDNSYTLENAVSVFKKDNNLPLFPARLNNGRQGGYVCSLIEDCEDHTPSNVTHAKIHSNKLHFPLASRVSQLDSGENNYMVIETGINQQQYSTNGNEFDRFLALSEKRNTASKRGESMDPKFILEKMKEALNKVEEAYSESSVEKNGIKICLVNPGRATIEGENRLAMIQQFFNSDIVIISDSSFALDSKKSEEEIEGIRRGIDRLCISFGFSHNIHPTTRSAILVRNHLKPIFGEIEAQGCVKDRCSLVRVALDNQLFEIISLYAPVASMADREQIIFFHNFDDFLKRSPAAPGASRIIAGDYNCILDRDLDTTVLDRDIAGSGGFVKTMMNRHGMADVIRFLAKDQVVGTNLSSTYSEVTNTRSVRNIDRIFVSKHSLNDFVGFAVNYARQTTGHYFLELYYHGMTKEQMIARKRSAFIIKTLRKASFGGIDSVRDLLDDPGEYSVPVYGDEDLTPVWALELLLLILLPRMLAFNLVKVLQIA